MKNRFKIGYLICFIFIIITSGCKKTLKENIIYNLTNNSFKYWDIVEHPGNYYYKNKSKRFPIYCYYFDIKGNFSSMVYPINKGRRKRTIPFTKDFSDYIVPDTWEYESDSIIKIQGYEYRIIKLTEDSLIISSLSASYLGRMVMVKSIQQ